MSEYGQPQQPAPKPPKKSSTARNVAIALFVTLGGVAVVGSAFGAGSDSGSSDKPAVVSTTPDPTTAPASKPTTKPSTRKPVEQAPKVACADQEDRNAPCAVQVGKPFQLGSHTVRAGWRVTSEYGQMAITGRATNTSGESSTMFIEVKFLDGDDVLAVVSCSTDELEPGQSQAMSCFSTDAYTKAYTKVTAEADF